MARCDSVGFRFDLVGLTWTDLDWVGLSPILCPESGKEPECLPPPPSASTTKFGGPFLWDLVIGPWLLKTDPFQPLALSFKFPPSAIPPRFRRNNVTTRMNIGDCRIFQATP
jgi:hypothetical protein